MTFCKILQIKINRFLIQVNWPGQSDPSSQGPWLKARPEKNSYFYPGFQYTWKNQWVTQLFALVRAKRQIIMHLSVLITLWKFIPPNTFARSQVQNYGSSKFWWYFYNFLPVNRKEWANYYNYINLIIKWHEIALTLYSILLFIVVLMGWTWVKISSESLIPFRWLILVWWIIDAFYLIKWFQTI